MSQDLKFSQIPRGSLPNDRGSIPDPLQTLSKSRRPRHESVQCS